MPNGSLDPSFGTGGVVPLGTALSADGQLDIASSVAVRPDGRIAVGGASESSKLLVTALVTLLNSDGTVDTGFGTSGLMTIPLPVGSTGVAILGETDFLSTGGIIAQADGSLLDEINAIIPYPGFGNVAEVVMTKIDANGVVDPSYGTQGQTVISPAGLASNVRSIGAGAIMLQADGKLLVAGGARYLTAGPLFVEEVNPAVIRLNTDGSLDSSFGLGGLDILVQRAVQFGGVANSIDIAANGSFVTGNAKNASFTRFLPNGLPDLSFGEAGTASFPTSGPLGADVASHVVSQSATGQILGVLNGYNGPGLGRLLAQGASNDFNGDGISDPAILLTDQSIFAAQYFAGPGGSGTITQFGSDGAGNTIPAPGAFDGGGVDEVGVYLPLLGDFAYRPYHAGQPGLKVSDIFIHLSTPGNRLATPAPGDYDRSGKTDPAVYDAQQGAFVYRSAVTDSNVVVPFGTKGSTTQIPVPADYYGTGQDDFALYLPDQGAFLIRNPITGVDSTVPFGTPGPGQTIPLPGDYDGSGHVELAVYLPQSGTLVYRPAAGGPDVSVKFGNPGLARTIPSAGDYDGSGHLEVAGYDPAAGTFSFVPKGGGAPITESFGIGGGKAVPFALATSSTGIANQGLPAPISPGILVDLGIPGLPSTTDPILPTPKKGGTR